MAKYNVTAFNNVFVQLQNPRRLADQLGECSLALLERAAAQVFTGQLELPSDQCTTGCASGALPTALVMRPSHQPAGAP
jgi:hypothetical protein